jgi:hypothetical protein
MPPATPVDLISILARARGVRLVIAKSGENATEIRHDLGIPDVLFK